MLATKYKHAFNRLIAPVAAPFVRLGVHPTAITLAGPILETLACLWLLRSRAIVPFCIISLVIGCCDGLDGVVARASGKVTKFGGYLDALSDRYFESVIAVTVASITGYWALSMTALTGALFVSYAKARAAMEVPISNLEWPDLMERTERGVIFLVGLALSRLLDWQPMGRDLFWWTLVLLNILVAFTLIQRIRRAHQLILERSHG